MLLVFILVLIFFLFLFYLIKSKTDSNSFVKKLFTPVKKDNNTSDPLLSTNDSYDFEIELEQQSSFSLNSIEQIDIFGDMGTKDNSFLKLF